MGSLLVGRRAVQRSRNAGTELAPNLENRKRLQDTYRPEQLTKVVLIAAVRYVVLACLRMEQHFVSVFELLSFAEGLYSAYVRHY